MKKRIFRVLYIFLAAALTFGAAVIILNAHVVNTAKPFLLTPEEAVRLEQMDCVLILGCGVRPNGEPSLMLRDRLDMGLALFDAGIAPKLLMSGDHGQANYDEVNAMKNYAMAAGVPSSHVFMDHAGFST